MESIYGLGEQEFQSVVDVLGQVHAPDPIPMIFRSLTLSTLKYVRTGDVMNGLRKRCFRFLCKICSAHGILPEQYTLNVGSLQRGEIPDYGGGFGEVWRGTYNETAVAIKKLKGVTATQLRKRKEVCRSAWAVYGRG